MAAFGEPIPGQQQNHVMEEAKRTIESGRGWDRELQEKAPANIKEMVRLIEPALRAKDAQGTKKQKVWRISYWTTFCAAKGLGAEKYGGPMPDEVAKRILRMHEEMAMLAGFSGYVVMYHRKKRKAHNGVSDSERAVSVLKAY